MQSTEAVAQPERSSGKSVRLHYLDWLRVLAILGVFLFHAVHPFDATDWHIKNAEQSFLDFSNKWLQYGQEMIMPFFLFHQAVIIVIAYYVVQWDTSAKLGAGAGILVKLLVVVLSSFVVTLGLYELFLRRISAVRVLFGMKSRRRETPQIEAAQPGADPSTSLGTGPSTSLRTGPPG